MNDLEFKRDFKYEIVHPYNVAKEDALKVEVTLKLCTLFRGKPNGLGYINYKDPKSKWLSFDGVGVFSDGKLHMGPFTCLN